MVSVGSYINICNWELAPNRGYDVTIVLSESSDVTEEKLYAAGEAITYVVEYMASNRYAKEKIQYYVEEKLKEFFADDFVDIIDVFVKTKRR